MNKLTSDQKARPFGTERPGLIKQRNFLFLAGMFMTMFLLNFGRYVCSQNCLNYEWYQRILYDNIHHYQIGLVLFPATYVLLRTLPRLRSILLGVSTALILDELFFVVEFVGIDPYFHRTFLRWLSFDLVAFTVFIYLYNFMKKRVSSIHEIDERRTMNQ